MIREDGLTICDYSSICVNDGNVLAQGYLELSNDGLIMHDSMSNMPLGMSKDGKALYDHTRGMVADMRSHRLPTVHTTDTPLHFLDEEAMELYFKERV